jgi:hypothetical protein
MLICSGEGWTHRIARVGDSLDVFSTRERGEYGDGESCIVLHHPAYLPDLSDPATLGCLLALVREVHGEPTAHLVASWRDRLDNNEPEVVWYIERAREDDTEWLRCSGAWGEMEDWHRDPPLCSPDEREALVAALESAP